MAVTFKRGTPKSNPKQIYELGIGDCFYTIDDGQFFMITREKQDSNCIEGVRLNDGGTLKFISDVIVQKVDIEMIYTPSSE